MNDTARVYVGTYAKYNGGSIQGAWIDLEECGNIATFLEKCAELHSDESDPELMFQDFEGFPEAFYCESHIDPAVFDWIELGGDDRELLQVYQEKIDSSGDIDKAREAFNGKFDSESDWAEQYWDDCGMLSEVPQFARNYIDFESYARDARLGGDMVFIRHNGGVWAFSNNV